MLDMLRAWDLAQDELLILSPNESLASAVAKLLARLGHGAPCGIVQDEGGRFLGTLSTHRALRAIGESIQSLGAMKAGRGVVDTDKAVHAACRVVGAHTVREHMYTKTLEVPPSATVSEVLQRFAGNTAHYVVVTEAGKALGLLELDDLFKTFAQDMCSENPLEM